MNDTRQIEDTQDRVQERADHEAESFDQQFDGEPYGLNALSDPEQAAWFDGWAGRFRPLEVFKVSVKGLKEPELKRLRRFLGREPIEGEYITGNAWVLMLDFTENGGEELARYQKTRGIGASRMPQEQGVY